MRKSVFLILLIATAFSAKAQTGFNDTNNYSGNNILKITSKTKSIIKEVDLLASFSAHEHLSLPKYSPDTATPSAVGAPNPFLHYKLLPEIEINYDLTSRFYILSKYFFVETGIEWNYFHSGFDKTNGSHIENAKWYINYLKYSGEIAKDSATLAAATQERDISSTLSIPILIGVRYKFLSISVGTVRDVYYWIKGTYTPDIGLNYSYQGLVTNYNGRPLNPVVNLSATVIDRKFKLAPFVSYRFSELFIGTEIGYGLKKS
jgi:hypothetical protein